MLNLLWGGMILIGILWGAFHGTLGVVTDQILSSAKDAVNLCITMLGILSFWSGILEIGEQAGLLERFSHLLRPAMRFLFPEVPDDHPAQTAISTNIIANMLGLGMAATPAGLKAMESLADLEKERGRAAGIASNEMCTFLIINIASLQLIPVNMIAYRSQYGSVNPAAIVGPGIVETAVSALVAVLYCKWKGRKKRGE